MIIPFSKNMVQWKKRWKQSKNLLILGEQAVQYQGTIISMQCLLEQNVNRICTWKHCWSGRFLFLNTLGFFILALQIEASKFLSHCWLIQIKIKDSICYFIYICIRYQYKNKNSISYNMVNQGWNCIQHKSCTYKIQSNLDGQQT